MNQNAIFVFVCLKMTMIHITCNSISRLINHQYVIHLQIVKEFTQFYLTALYDKKINTITIFIKKKIPPALQICNLPVTKTLFIFSHKVTLYLLKEEQDYMDLSDIKRKNKKSIV